MKRMKKLIAMMLLLAMLGMTFAAAEEDQKATLITPYLDEVESYTSETVPLYFLSLEDKMDITAYFVNGEHGIPYVDVETIADILTEYYHVILDCEDYSLTLEQSDHIAMLIRENESYAFFNTEENLIFLSDSNLFNRFPYAANSLDIVETGTRSKDEENNLISHTSYISRSGGFTYYYLDDYCIRLVELDGKICVPLQTFNDLIFAQNEACLAYNGEAVFAFTIKEIADSTSEFYKLYRDVESTTKSEEMTFFTYNELCLALDCNYGLMDEHHIESFDKLFIDTGAAVKIFSDNSAETFSGLSDVILYYLADKHSSPMMKSPTGETTNVVYDSSTDEKAVAAGADFVIDQDQLNVLILNAEYFMTRARYTDAREVYYPDGVAGYEEVGNTAFVTFDTFTLDEERDYYDTETEVTNNAEDTIELLIYANQQIHREDSPIENVVIDLTNNAGGHADAAVCVVAWFLSYCKLNLRDVKSEASSSLTYMFDADLDHHFTEETDSVTKLNRYCLISPNSFSCGNLVPNAFKSSDQVTLIGRTSGGGACSVLVLSTADGSIFTISSRYQIVNVMNGSGYSVDTGATPDIYIKDISKLYDRQYIVDLINEP